MSAFSAIFLLTFRKLSLSFFLLCPTFYFFSVLFSQCCSFKELRQLFLLLIRRFKPSVQSRQFLTDVVCGNHDLLVMIERVNADPDLMSSHLKQVRGLNVNVVILFLGKSQTVCFFPHV